MSHQEEEDEVPYTNAQVKLLYEDAKRIMKQKTRVYTHHKIEPEKTDQEKEQEEQERQIIAYADQTEAGN